MDKRGCARTVRGKYCFCGNHALGTSEAFYFLLVGVEHELQTKAVRHQPAGPLADVRVEMRGKPLRRSVESKPKMGFGIGVADEEPGTSETGRNSIFGEHVYRLRDYIVIEG